MATFRWLIGQGRRFEMRAYIQVLGKGGEGGMGTRRRHRLISMTTSALPRCLSLSLSPRLSFTSGGLSQRTDVASEAMRGLMRMLYTWCIVDLFRFLSPDWYHLGGENKHCWYFSSRNLSIILDKKTQLFYVQSSRRMYVNMASIMWILRAV